VCMGIEVEMVEVWLEVEEPIGIAKVVWIGSLAFLGRVSFWLEGSYRRHVLGFVQNIWLHGHSDVFCP
jgi:hypothetical protein